MWLKIIKKKKKITFPVRMNHKYKTNQCLHLKRELSNWHFKSVTSEVLKNVIELKKV